MTLFDNLLHCCCWKGLNIKPIGILLVFPGGVLPWQLLVVPSMPLEVWMTTHASMMWNDTTLKATAGAPWHRWTHPEEEWDLWRWGYDSWEAIEWWLKCKEFTLKFSALIPSACQSFVYAVGGNDGVASLSSVERFNPHLNKWTQISEMGQRRAGNGVSKLNGCLYVVGERNIFT